MRSWLGGLGLGILWVGLWSRLPPSGLVSLLCVLACLGCGRRRSWQLCAGGLAVGIALGVLHGQQMLERRLPEECAGRQLSLVGRIASLPRHTTMADETPRQRFELQVETLLPGDCSGPRRLLLSYYGERAFSPGERWRFPVKLQRPWGLANPASHNFQAWFAQTGIDAVGSVSAGGGQLLEGAKPWEQPHHRLRQTVSRAIAGLDVEAEVKAVLQAVTVADKSGIDGRLWSLLQAYGINHLMVISGLHVGMVAGFAYLIGGLLVRLLPPAGAYTMALQGLAALLLAAIYTALAGFSLPTLRALCMLACFILASTAGYRGSGFNALLLAAVAILVANPLAGLGSGFWLSFSAVGALLWYGPWRRGALPGRVAGVHVFMCLVMIPVGSWWFGGASLVSAPANLLMIPLVGMLVVPAALSGALCHLLGLPFDETLWKLAGWPLQQLLPLARHLAEEGEAWMYQPLHGAVPALVLAATGVLLWAIPAGAAGKICAGLLLLPLLLPYAGAPQVPPGHTVVTVLDVGQGTAALIESGDRALLYDTGGGDPAGANMARAVILPYLRSRGIRRLDTFVVSHPDLDHAAGTTEVLRAFDAGRQRFGGMLPQMPRGRSCVAGESWRWPSGQVFRFLSPALENGLPSNDSSCVLSLDTGGHRLLFTGDIEAARERELVRYWREELESDWLFAAHHGSLTSSSPTFLKHVAPRIIVISHGYGNRFGHPHPRVLRRLRSTAPEVYSTAGSGALRFEFAPGKPIRVEAHRDGVRRYWL